MSGETLSARGKSKPGMGWVSAHDVTMGQRSNPVGQRSNRACQRSNPVGQRSNRLILSFQSVSAFVDRVWMVSDSVKE
jgi:hypothetical protein